MHPTLQLLFSLYCSFASLSLPAASDLPCPQGVGVYAPTFPSFLRTSSSVRIPISLVLLISFWSNALKLFFPLRLSSPLHYMWYSAGLLEGSATGPALLMRISGSCPFLTVLTVLVMRERGAPIPSVSTSTGMLPFCIWMYVSTFLLRPNLNLNCSKNEL